MDSIRVSSTPAEMEPRVCIHTLGRFELVADGAPIRFAARAHRRSLELLKSLIALGGEAVHEHLLSEALWPDADGDQAHSSFSVTLHRLRKLIGAEALLLRERRLTLDRQVCWTDARAFCDQVDLVSEALAAAEADAALAALDRALPLYRGPFLEGEFEPHPILSARQRLHEKFLRAVRDVARQFRERGLHEEAINLLRRGLEIDDQSEELYRDLMQSLLALGRAADGLAVYQRCSDVLRAAVGIEPAPETRAIHQSLLSLATTGAPSASAPAASLPEPPSGHPVAPGRARRRIRVSALGVGAVLVVVLALGTYLVRPEWLGMQPSIVPALAVRPTIAVLPLQNMSGDPEQEYLSDGITETLLTRLAKVPELVVIARNSSFAYKGRPLDARQVGRELGVRYLVAGSVQRTDHRIRIAAQLIDTTDGRHLWAELYDRELQDLFAVQDDIALRVANQLNVQLVRGEWARSDLAATDNILAYDLYLQAQHLSLSYEKEPNLRAIGLLRQAIEFDPSYGRAMGLLGWRYLLSQRYGWGHDPAWAAQQAEALATRALAIAPDTQAYTLLARLHSNRGDYAQAISIGRKAVALEPSNAWALATLAWSFVLADRAAEGVPLMERAVRLAPHTPLLMRVVQGKASYFAKRYEEAAQAFQGALDSQPDQGFLAREARLHLIASRVALGQLARARAEAAPFRDNPEYSIAGMLSAWGRYGHKNHEPLVQTAERLRLAGLPD